MAEHGARESSSRRVLYRRLVADPATLPPNFLEALESKRRALDESIHKFIAAKERELKQWIKEQKQLHRQQMQEREGKIENARRRTSSESTQDTLDSPLLLGRRQPGLLSASLRREEDSSAIAPDEDEREQLEPRAVEAGLADRRASIERDKEFLGVFTPSFLPALESQGQPPNDEKDPSTRSNAETPNGGKDQPAQADKAARPLQLLTQRTSSSGSSAERGLTSVLKSPTAGPTKRKRVSIAVGDLIVAPADSVPLALTHNSTASHSRRSVPVSELENLLKAGELKIVPAEVKTASSTLSAVIAAPTQSTDSTLATPQQTSQLPVVNESLPASGAPASQPSPKKAPKPAPKKIDPDGDLFDLDDENDPIEQSENDADLQRELEGDISGRVSRAIGQPGAPGGTTTADDELYEPSEGLLTDPSELESETEIEFRPGSTQQPASPGFRRPAAAADPVYAGADYTRAEHHAVVNEIYGSSYNRPTSKGSFSAGSLGESYMARNAEQLRTRTAQEQAQVR